MCNVSISNALSSHLLCISLREQATEKLLEQHEAEIQPLAIFFYRHVIPRGLIAVSSQSVGCELCHFRSCSDIIAWTTLCAICHRHCFAPAAGPELSESSLAQLCNAGPGPPAFCRAIRKYITRSCNSLWQSRPKCTGTGKSVCLKLQLNFGIFVGIPA